MDNQGCAGTLVGDKYVVTAAHCTAGSVPSNLKVVVGETTLAISEDTQRFVMEIAVIKQHPNYDPNTLSNDISVLELATVVDLTTYPHIKPACLPSTSMISDFIGQPAIVSGWGTVGSGLYLNSHLHDVSVEVYGKTNCGTHTSAMTSDMFCAGLMVGGKDSCQGDSGGPLVTIDSNNKGALTLIGIVSWGYGCADINAPGVYSDVPFFMQSGWLMQQLTNLNTCAAPSTLIPNPVSSPAPPTAPTAAPTTAPTAAPTAAPTGAPPSLPPGTCVTTAGDACVFPFVWQGRKFTTCTSSDADSPWCATSGGWGYCSPGCPGGNY